MYGVHVVTLEITSHIILIKSGRPLRFEAWRGEVELPTTPAFASLVRHNWVLHPAQNVLKSDFR